MTKIQKIWFTIFGLIFIAPEIIWSPVLNFYYELLQSDQNGGTHPFRETYLTSSDHLTAFKIIVFIEFISLIGAIYIINKSEIKNKIFKTILIIILVLLALVTFLPAIYQFGF